MHFNFTNSDLGTTKYFYADHDDGMMIEIDGQLVYNRQLGSRPAFSMLIDASKINRPIPVKMTWGQYTGPCRCILKVSNSFSNNINDYGPIPNSMVSTLTPITGVIPTDLRNTSFYTLTHHLSILTHHNHPYTDYGLTAAEYNQIKNSVADSAQWTRTVNTAVGSYLKIDYNPPSSTAFQQNDGSAYVRNVNTDAKNPFGQDAPEVFTIIVAPFSVNI
jgi:hypothetical protein